MAAEAQPAPEGRGPVDTSGDVPTITLGGETIDCVEVIAPGPLLDVAAVAERPNDIIAQAAAFQRFLFAVVAEGEEPTLEMLLHRKRDPVDFDDLAEVVGRLTEWYASRPTRRPARSRGGPPSTSDSSTDGSHSPDSPPQTGEGGTKTVSLQHGTVTDGEDEADREAPPTEDSTSAAS